MLGRAQVMTPEGVRELPVYVDNKDLADDYHAGVIKPDEEIVYKNAICSVLDKFTDEDGEEYTQLIATNIGGTGPTCWANPNPPGFQHVEFRMG